MPSKPNVFDYLDYRDYLRDTYEFKKAERSSFSYRAFARRAGTKAPNHLKRVIDGDRHLGAAAMPGYLRALDLSGDEAEFFQELVALASSKTLRARREILARLNRFRGYRAAQHLDVDFREYHSEWYIPAIREMVATPHFRNDPKWIGQRLLPKVSSKDVKRALALLERLGMIEKVGDDYHASHPVVSTGALVERVHVAAFHETMSRKAVASIEEVPHALRELGGLTFSVGEDQLEALKARLREIRRELIAFEETGTRQRVVHVNIQLFPLTENLEK